MYTYLASPKNGGSQREVDFVRSRRQVVSRVEHLGEYTETAYRKGKDRKFNPSRLGQASNW